MQFIVIASLIASVLAVPAEMAPRSYYGHVCADGLYSNAQCCTPDILGVACLDANVRKLLRLISTPAVWRLTSLLPQLLRSPATATTFALFAPKLASPPSAVSSLLYVSKCPGVSAALIY